MPYVKNINFKFREGFVKKYLLSYPFLLWTVKWFTKNIVLQPKSKYVPKDACWKSDRVLDNSLQYYNNYNLMNKLENYIIHDEPSTNYLSPYTSYIINYRLNNAKWILNNKLSLLLKGLCMYKQDYVYVSLQLLSGAVLRTQINNAII